MKKLLLQIELKAATLILIALALSACSPPREQNSREVVSQMLTDNKRLTGEFQLGQMYKNEPYLLEITKFNSWTGSTEAEITFRNQLAYIPRVPRGMTLTTGDPLKTIPASDPRRQPYTLKLKGKFQKGSLVLTRIKNKRDTIDEFYTLAGERHDIDSGRIEAIYFSRTRETSAPATSERRPEPYAGTREDWLQN